jgi:hypothetical protein
LALSQSCRRPKKKADAEINGSLKVGKLPGGRRWLPAVNFKLI